MSRPVPQGITCPVCNNEDTVTIWDSLDAQANPTEKDKLIDGSLFEYTCPKCGAKTILNYACLYADPERALTVYYVPEVDAIQEVTELLDSMSKESIASPDTERDPRLRIVTSLNDLREKAAIFDDDLDDRVVEILKHLFCEYLESSADEETAEFGSVFYSGTDADNNIILYISGDNPREAVAPMEMYEQLEDQILFDQVNVGSEYIIDQSWAKALLTRLEFMQESEQVNE